MCPRISLCGLASRFRLITLLWSALRYFQTSHRNCCLLFFPPWVVALVSLGRMASFCTAGILWFGCSCSKLTLKDDLENPKALFPLPSHPTWKGSPRANLHRDQETREANTWLKEWCGKEGFHFMGHWHQYWNRRDLYRWDGLHLNRSKTSVPTKRINRVVTRTLS